MPILRVEVDRFSLVSSSPFAQIVEAIEEAVGHPDMREFGMKAGGAKSWQELEQVIHGFIGPSGFMEFARFDMGLILSKEQSATAPKIVRLVIGNPLIMKQMVEDVHDAASYAPVTVLVDERVDGVHVSYDLMASYLLPYGNLAALKVARELDAKVKALLTAAAG